jgi:hypothetical protein
MIEVMGLPSPEWLSTTLAEQAGLEHLRVTTIGQLAKGSKAVTVVAAYWDEPFLSALLGAIAPSRRKATSVKVFVNGFSGKRGADEAGVLNALAALWWKRGFRDLSINVVPGWRLFHSKLLVFERTNGSIVLVGSANATEAAFTDNEELMMMLRAPRIPSGVRRYVDAVAKVALPIETIAPFEARTLASFFRGGDVYYRPTIVTSFRFDLRLPAELREAMTRLQVPIPGITARAGQTYNPFAEVGLTVEEEKELSETGNPDAETAQGAGRVSLRNYGVQTCYGWWVPNAYAGNVEKKLAPTRARRSALLKQLAHLLAQECDALRSKAAERFDRLVKFAAKEGYRLIESRQRRIDRFDEFLDRTSKRLADARWRKRAEQPYVQASVPEVWNDPTSSEEFIDSVFDYLEFVATTRKRPIIWRSLVEIVPSLGSASSSDEIRRSVSSHLATQGWRHENWLGAEE